MDYSSLGLLLILLAILVLPFLFKAIEHNLELFFLTMGIFAVSITARWSGHLVETAVLDPLPITGAVFISGLIFRELKKYLNRFVQQTISVIGIRFFLFFLLIFVGLTSSIFTAIITSIFLVEVVALLRVARKQEIGIVVLGCYVIGLGAALTPIGEPLATIAVSKMKGDFFYLLRLLWLFVVPGIFLLSLAGFFFKPVSKGDGLEIPKSEELTLGILWRAVKVYLFVLALVLLGEGFTPLIERYIIHLPYLVLYWLNTISAVLDNATLAAAELSPAMSPVQVRAILLGLLLAGGMLIPGNIPNIISAGILRISMKEWAVWGIPIGIPLLVICFLILLIL